MLAALRDTPVVLLSGARQTGKSTLVQALAASTHPARYLTFDDAGVLAAARSDPSGFLAGLDQPVILDEVQRAPELFLALKLAVDRNRQPGRFLLTGYVDGMVGTGSNDVVIDNVYVPPERSVSMLEMSCGHGPGSLLHDGPLYHTPMLPIPTLAATTPALGQARMAVRRFRERLVDRVRLGSRTKQMDNASAQMRLARVEVEVREVELLLRDTVADVRARRNTATRLDRARWATHSAMAVDRCKRVIQTVVEASGAHVHFLDIPCNARSVM